VDILDTAGYSFKGLEKVNVILGKNGCGKSTALKSAQKSLEHSGNYGSTGYITPERGGSLIFDAGLAQNSTNEAWLNNQLRKNQFTQFKERTLLQFRKLELLSLRELESTAGLRADASYGFQSIVDLINSLLDNIELRREGDDFRIYSLPEGSKISPENISSGESELIALGIECLVFAKECKEGLPNVLFLDEPDAHLHPDLQRRLGRFLQSLVEAHGFTIVAATHSTSFLGAFESYKGVRISFMTAKQKEISFTPVTEVYRKVLPVFGAHPLSNVFNESPILLVEGEDDERVWQQAVRTSQGRVKVFPCSVDSITRLNEYEVEVARIIRSVYDNAIAYSLRDRDDSQEEIGDISPVVRMKLSCRAAENLLLADDVLSRLGTGWLQLVENLDVWLEHNAEHPHHSFMRMFKEGGYDRKRFDLKEIRNDIMGVVGSSKPWEVVVGQAIGMLQEHIVAVENSLANYLGQKVVVNLLASRDGGN
jgi:energy-coupling factor transporter ATP-binding protein EcfA2